MIEEAPPAVLPLDDERVRKARAKLFGSWEMSWLPYNYAHDVRLPGSKGPDLPFLVYPQAETASGRKDCLDAESFRYSISAVEVSALPG